MAFHRHFPNTRSLTTQHAIPFLTAYLQQLSQGGGASPVPATPVLVPHAPQVQQMHPAFHSSYPHPSPQLQPQQPSPAQMQSLYVPHNPAPGYFYPR